jgi:hypothetical protein
VLDGGTGAGALLIRVDARTGAQTVLVPAGAARGDRTLRCRLEDPATSATRYQDTAPFAVR